jgi:hypothetical protein
MDKHGKAEYNQLSAETTKPARDMQMQHSGGNNLDSQNATPSPTKALTKFTQQRAVAGALALGRHRNWACVTAGYNNPRAANSNSTALQIRHYIM